MTQVTRASAAPTQQPRAPMHGAARYRARAAWATVGLIVALACGPTEEIYQVTGTVRSLSEPDRQLHVAHEEIPGFMPAMTMSFDVASADLLEGLAPGDRIRFELLRTGSLLRIESIDKTGEVDVSAGRAGGIEPGPGEQDPAPAVSLVDQDGRRFELASLRGHAVVVDFIFTRCAGPCPILTARHVELQKGLPEDLRECARFVSVSVDPEYDRPHVLRAYARTRGIDLEGWSLLTGESEEIDAVLTAYGVGAVRTDRRNLEHTIATFLIDPRGQIARRYLGLGGTSAAGMQEDLRATCG